MTVYLNSVERQGKNKKIKVVRKSRNFKFSQLFYVLGGLVILLGLFYGVIANKVVTTGYDIKTNEKKLNMMKDENDELRIKISELKSVQILEDKVVEMGMTEPKVVDYMRIGREIAIGNIH